MSIEHDSQGAVTVHIGRDELSLELQTCAGDMKDAGYDTIVLAPARSLDGSELVRLHFEKVESVDTFIRWLETLRARMDGSLPRDAPAVGLVRLVQRQ